MRITKKFSSSFEGPIGKKSFRLGGVRVVKQQDISEATHELQLLEFLFKLSLTEITSSDLEQLKELHDLQRKHLFRRHEQERKRLQKK
jgi:hypothetical protein